MSSPEGPRARYAKPIAQCGVDAERHVALEAVVDDGGDQLPFLRRDGFALDHRCNLQDLVWRSASTPSRPQVDCPPPLQGGKLILDQRLCAGV